MKEQGTNPAISPRLLALLREAVSTVVFTGAGMSAESGVPTFRGDEGIWKKFKPEELANLDAFMKNPELVWEWYKARKKIISSIEPNAGHHALAEWERRWGNITIITQNIDNLHRRAGSRAVHELHGNIERNYCMGCGRYYPNEEILRVVEAPRCSRCKGLIRPDVVWFGEQLPVDEWNAGVESAQKSELFLCVGTSAVVYPAASLPAIARKAGAYVVEINVEPTDLTHMADEALRGKAGEILPELFRHVKPIDQTTRTNS